MTWNTIIIAMWSFTAGLWLSNWMNHKTIKIWRQLAGEWCDEYKKIRDLYLARQRHDDDPADWWKK